MINDQLMSLQSLILSKRLILNVLKVNDLILILQFIDLLKANLF